MSDRTRVLLVTPNYPPPPGGIQTLTANLERGLLVHDVDVEVLVSDWTPADATLADVCSAPRWCHSIRSVLSGEALSLAATYCRTRSLIESSRPDVVHAMHIVDWPALVAASEKGIPSVLTTHALELGRTSLARKAIGEATLVHAVSEFTRELTGEVTESRVRSRVIPPSIAVDEYPTRPDSAVETGTEFGTAVITTAARLVERKNVETLIDAVKGLDARLDRDVVLRVIGDGPKREELETRAASAPVSFEGWVSEARKRRLLAESDVFALIPRRIGFDVEGFGIVYIEAQAAGVPVVGSRHGGVPEAIGDGGLVVENERRSTDVAVALERLLTDADLRARRSAAATRRVDGFDLSTIAARHLDAYDAARSGTADSGPIGRLHDEALL